MSERILPRPSGSGIRHVHGLPCYGMTQTLAVLRAAPSDRLAAYWEAEYARRGTRSYGLCGPRWDRRRAIGVRLRGRYDADWEATDAR